MKEIAINQQISIEISVLALPYSPLNSNNKNLTTLSIAV